MSQPQRPAPPVSDCSAGECCAQAQAASYARAEVLRFAPARPGPLLRGRQLIGRFLARVGLPRG